jgi:predicted ATPase/DNA-binding SARP family transcriptional activator
MDATVRLWFLGAARAEVAGNLVPRFESRRALALLAYLAAQRDALPRVELAAWFWPDQPDARARANLRGLVHNIATRLPGCLAVDRQTVRLVGAPACWTDTAAFETLVAHNTPDALAAAAELYRGPFLDGLYLDDCPEVEAWLTQTREHWHERAAEVLSELAARYHECEEWISALRWVDRLLLLEPWREAAHQEKMRLLALSGQRDSAMAQFEICRRVLADELGLSPTPQTTTLYEQIRDGALALPARPAPSRFQAPLPLTPLLGRTQERAQITALLADPVCRLVTLVGPGGIGKTRLALDVTASLRDTFADIFFVDLAPLDDANLVPAAIARTLAVRETHDEPLLASLKAYLRDARVLLLLDNFEQVLAAAPLVAELLAACPHLSVLATSRQELHLRGEHVFAVPPLALPEANLRPNPASLAENAAVALFVERATRHQPGFSLSSENAAAVAEICRRLDGLPLAIELAAARVSLFMPLALLQRLSNPLDVLTRGPHDLPARQQTLQNTLDWSYKLLESGEQTLFAQLAVFVGGWTLEAVETVCGDCAAIERSVLDEFQGLLDKQLVRQNLRGDAQPGFTMLETIREYALARLAQESDEIELRQRHAAYYLALAEATPAALNQSNSTQLALIKAEYDNLLAALRWMLERNDCEGSIRLCNGLHGFWHSHGHLSEGRSWLQAALALPCLAPSFARATAFAAASGFAVIQGDWPEAIALLDQALAISRVLGDTTYTGGLLREQGWLALTRGEYGTATRLLEESAALYRTLGDNYGIAAALGYLGQATYEQGFFVQAVPLLEEGLAISRALDDHIAVGWSLNKLGLVALYRGELSEAERLLAESLGVFAALEHKGGTAWGRGSLGWIGLKRGDHARAAELFEDSLVHYGEVGDKRNIAFGLERLACLAITQRLAARAARLFGAAQALRLSHAVPLPPADEAYYAPYREMLRAALDARSLARALAEGTALPADQVIAYGLHNAPAAEAQARAQELVAPAPPEERLCHAERSEASRGARRDASLGSK